MDNQNVQQNNQQSKTPPAQFKLPKNDYTKFDDKTIATIKASAIWDTVAAIIRSVAGMLASYFFLKSLYGNLLGQYGQYLGGYMDQIYKPQIINIGVLVNDVIWGAIGGAIAGWVIAKFYPVFVDWQKKYTGNKLNSFFKILFWPYLAGFVISLVINGALSMMFSSFSIFIITALADLAGIYLYAKMMDKAVGKYYKQG